ncbi:MAG TPA: M15 family metallopeptidase [Candidatus Limnocylindria bacterium]|nr:M15 family metallopeptidase [Candidatus Limnocylindria bacterium]
MSRNRGPGVAPRTRLALAGLAVVAVLLAVSASSPSGVSATTDDPPPCKLANWFTVPRGYDDWSHTLVDWQLRVEWNYKPPDLVPVSEAGIPGGGFLRKVTIRDTRAMGEASRAAGAGIGIWSPYRSFKYQVQIFNDYVALDGYRDAITYSMRPGHSEHQLGLGVDFMSAGGGSPLPGDWGQTPAGRWMRENSWKYGWVNSYPLGDNGELFNPRTCFHYEPWHYRYLGRAMARKVHDSGLTIREYLWKHYVMVDPVTGQALATPTPTPSPTPAATPTPTPPASTTGASSAAISATSAASPAPSFGDGPLGLDPLVVVAVAAAVVVLASLALAAARRGGSGE